MRVTLDESLEDILEKVVGGVFLFEGAYIRHPFDFSPEIRGISGLSPVILEFQRL